MKGPFVIKKIFSDVVFRIQHRDPPRKCLVVHFNRLKPYLLCSRDAQEGTEQLSKQKDDEQDPSFTDKEVRELASPDSDTEGEVIIEEEHQDDLMMSWRIRRSTKMSWRIRRQKLMKMRGLVNHLRWNLKHHYKLSWGLVIERRCKVILWY